MRVPVLPTMSMHQHFYDLWASAVEQIFDSQRIELKNIQREELERLNRNKRICMRFVSMLGRILGLTPAVLLEVPDFEIGEMIPDFGPCPVHCHRRRGCGR